MHETVWIGVGATLVMDAWGVVRNPLLRIPSPDYGLVGRWVAHMGRGRFRHEAIASAEPMPHETLIGWVVHYLTGIAFAALLVACVGTAWVEAPTVGPALLIGLGTAAVPFFVVQPALGAGIAASRTPRPNFARLQTLLTHGVFGMGLYAAAWTV